MSSFFSDENRRRRLVARHHLGRTATTPLEVVRSVAALHSTDPATPYLAAWARIPVFEIEQLEDALYEERRLRRMHAIRRTLFMVPSDEAPIWEAGAARAVARQERRKLVGWLTETMDEATIEPWLQRLANEIVETLGGRELSTREIAEEIPELATEVRVGTGKGATTLPISSRLLLLMAMDGSLVRTRPAGSWRSSQYRWSTSEAWQGEDSEPLELPEGLVGIAARYLRTHGPVTMNDLRWWTGWTLGSAKDALQGVDHETVSLEGGERGIVLAGDTEPEETLGPTVALLPGLDSTPMGWKDRHWYLGPHSHEIFDRNGNAGPTVWVNGSIVGGWGQRPDGEVVFELLEDVDALAEIREEAAALTAWLDGLVVMPRFQSPLGKRLAART